MEEQATYTPLVATPIKGEAPVLNAEVYETLKGMLRSPDEGNWKMAQMILNACDIKKSIYWIWKLTREGYASRMVNLRTKASRAFRDHSRLFYINSKGSLSFAEFCAREKMITPEIYQYLEEDIMNRADMQFRHTFYDTQYKIKDEYKHLNNNVEFIKANDKDE
jgi:hypothetical protein